MRGKEGKKIVEDLVPKSEFDVDVSHLGNLYIHYQHLRIIIIYFISVISIIAILLADAQHSDFKHISERYAQKHDDLNQRCKVLELENECLNVKLKENGENAVIFTRTITQLELNIKECNCLFQEKAEEVFTNIFISNQSDII